MSEKVKLPREVAGAISFYENSSTCSSRYNVMVVGFNVHDYCTTEDRIMQEYAKVNPDLFAKAVLDGYEVEQTPEDNVREYFKTLERDLRTVKYHRDSEVDLQHHAMTKAEMNGIVGTLNHLNIKIEGVNA